MAPKVAGSIPVTHPILFDRSNRRSFFMHSFSHIDEKRRQSYAVVTLPPLLFAGELVDVRAFNRLPALSPSCCEALR